MYKSQIKNNFKSQLNQEQRTAIKITKEFDKRKERISNSTSGYHHKIKQFQTLNSNIMIAKNHWKLW